MSLHLMFSLLLLPSGMALLYFGLQASQTSYEQDFESFSHSLTDSTAWCLVGGFMAILGGLTLLVIHYFQQLSLFTAT
ncbi:DUF3185 family protein [Marinospirillum sp.]|uniref:DUF3185 family protein n=1 Tax=Marinospirillum sp. TaxID=2183934 RepID=UPI00384EC023